MALSLFVFAMSSPCPTSLFPLVTPPCLVLVCLIVFTWSSCALLLYIVFLSLVSWLVRFGVYLFLGLWVKLWSCSSDFLISYLVIWYPCFLFVFSSSCFLISFLFRFSFTLCSSSSFLDLSFLFCLFDCLFVVFVCLCLCLVLFVMVSCPLPRFPDLWPLLPGSSSPLSRVKSLVLWVRTWQLDWCDFWDPLQATGSLLSCLTLPLELPRPCSSPLPPRTGSVVIPPASIVLSALSPCLDWSLLFLVNVL